MMEQAKTVAGFKVVAFKLHASEYSVRSGNKMVKVPGCKVQLWLDRTGGAAPESVFWGAGVNCNERVFTSTDAARRNALRDFGHIMER